jgi:hypothetical protein
VLHDPQALRLRAQLERLRRGTLVVLDAVPVDKTPNYDQQRASLEPLITSDAVFSGDSPCAVLCGAGVLPPRNSSIPDRSCTGYSEPARFITATLPIDYADALALYQRLRAANWRVVVYSSWVGEASVPRLRGPCLLCAAKKNRDRGLPAYLGMA